jgi:hypothetical protein
MDGLSDSKRATTPPSEPWFTQKDLAFDATNIDSIIADSKVFAQPLETRTKISDTLREECAHLIRKSQSSLAKASK